VHICLVALNAYPAIDPLVAGPIGGIETRSWMIARGLAARSGIDVQFVLRHHTQPRQLEYDGVRLVPLVDPLYGVWQSAAQAVERRTGFPWVRIKRWSPRLLWQLPRLAVDRLRRGRVYAADAPDSRLVAVGADVYATFGVQTHSSVVIRSAHEAGRPAILFLGSDGDLDSMFKPGGTGVDPYGTRAEVGRDILQSADVIVAQTESQQHRLRDLFGRESVLIRNPIDVAAWDREMQSPIDEFAVSGLERYVLWVGRAEELHKRPQLCLELARRCPEVQFLMILNPRDPAVETKIRATAPGNVRIVERIPFPQMPAIYTRAALLLNTSQLEGFPNVFLQASLSRIPIVSLEVGNEYLSEARAGRCSDGDLTAAAEFIRNDWSGGANDRFDADRARTYVTQRHAIDTQIDRLVSLFQEIATSKSGRR